MKGILLGALVLGAASSSGRSQTVDIHTVKHGPGELRDQWRPLDKTAAARLQASLEERHASAQPLAIGNCH
jgi:hypothetical protein